ncbi:DUF3089 domain-containing protein [Sphingomonas sanxanigenens]|uniref:DUF3089 domain-containing protein n=1 Tax=Sphingomonas sanxanigenens DSM 19645 = NX02 TaxID=1123269 RepID=W0AHK9_9SPHN|nr:DUF3089 domain-containing protein [Sphingomonas sanxanigenens]AHE55793.1 hypothetical protein NX02_20760 [Sphingomonas sanxanigenens DSM 19645 = NX02]
MAARRFLYVFAGLIVLAIAGLFAYRLFAPQLFRFAFVPSAPFVEQMPRQAAAYADPAMWLARPGLGNSDAAQWLPAGVSPRTADRAATFFIHPTSYLTRAQWNAPLDDRESQDRARLFVRSQASAFNHLGPVWAPKYRQAAFGAFLTDRPEAQRALDAAYADVAAAFDRFLQEAPADRPIILAAHSQGSLHLLRLLRDQVAGKPVAARIAAAYVVGWPVSLTTDVPRLGLPACTRADQPGCVLSWQSFAEPADPAMIRDVYEASTGFDGRPRKGTPMLCTNPLTGLPGGGAAPSANLGALIPNKDLSDATLEAGTIPARCDAGGFLLIGPPPASMDSPYVLPGNNFHVFDYTLFWSNIRADAARRTAAHAAAQPRGIEKLLRRLGGRR